MSKANHPGIGKSRILLALRRPKYVPMWLWRVVARHTPGIVYFDCEMKDLGLGDILMPYVGEEQ